MLSKYFLRKLGESVIISISSGVNKTVRNFETKSSCLLAILFTINFFLKKPFCFTRVKDNLFLSFSLSLISASILANSSPVFMVSTSFCALKLVPWDKKYIASRILVLPMVFGPIMIFVLENSQEAFL